MILQLASSLFLLLSSAPPDKDCLGSIEAEKRECVDQLIDEDLRVWMRGGETNLDEVLKVAREQKKRTVAIPTKLEAMRGVNLPVETPSQRCMKLFKESGDALQQCFIFNAYLFLVGEKSGYDSRIAATEEAFRKFRGEEGHRKTRWGMTRKDVLRLHPKAKSDKESLAVTGDVAGLPAMTIYSFTKGRLTMAVVLFSNSYISSGSYIKDYMKLKELLTTKYGKATRDETIWTDEASKAMGSISAGAAVATGGLKLEAEWGTKETKIILGCHGESGNVNLGIAYQSKAFEGFAAADRRQTQLNDL